MSERPLAKFEERLYSVGQQMSYPVTPDIAEKVRARFAAPPRRGGIPVRRLAWSLAILTALLLGLLAVPSVRAQIIEFLQIGVVRIFLVQPTATPTPLPATPSAAKTLTSAQIRATDTLVPIRTATPVLIPLTSVLALEGETTLQDAAQAVEFPIRLPAYPADLGPPDKVFLQDLDGQVLVFVWLDPDNPGKADMSLHQFSNAGSMTVTKIEPEVVQETSVNGHRAIWAGGPYLLKVRGQNLEIVRLVDGFVLIWEEGGVTYRLETSQPLEEAVRIAESLQPAP